MEKSNPQRARKGLHRRQGIVRARPRQNIKLAYRAFDESQRDFQIAGNLPDVLVGSIFFSQCAENVSQTGKLCGRIKHKVMTSPFL